jgi:hypothetical protein
MAKTLDEMQSSRQDIDQHVDNGIESFCQQVLHLSKNTFAGLGPCLGNLAKMLTFNEEQVLGTCDAKSHALFEGALGFSDIVNELGLTLKTVASFIFSATLGKVLTKIFMHYVFGPKHDRQIVLPEIDVVSKHRALNKTDAALLIVAACSFPLCFADQMFKDEQTSLASLVTNTQGACPNSVQNIVSGLTADYQAVLETLPKVAQDCVMQELSALQQNATLLCNMGVALVGENMKDVYAQLCQQADSFAMVMPLIAGFIGGGVGAGMQKVVARYQLPQ